MQNPNNFFFILESRFAKYSRNQINAGNVQNIWKISCKCWINFVHAVVLCSKHNNQPPNFWSEMIFIFHKQNEIESEKIMLWFMFGIVLAVLLCVNVLLSLEWEIAYGKTVSTASWSAQNYKINWMAWWGCCACND